MKPQTLMDIVKGKGRGLLARARLMREHQQIVASLVAKQERAEMIRTTFYHEWDPGAWWEQVFPRLHI